MAGETAHLWQVQSGAVNGSRTTATTSNTISFNAKPVTTSGGYIYKNEFGIRNAVPENESVGDNNNEVQDMGLDGIDVQITGIFENADTDADVGKLVRFMKEAKTVTGYTKGRFGLEMTEFPWFDVVPNGDANGLGTEYGYQLANCRFIQDGETFTIVGFVLTLRFGGDIDNAL